MSEQQPGDAVQFTDAQMWAAHEAYYAANPDGGYMQAMRAALTAAHEAAA